jgi:rhodanese-related sulfurtransferase
MNGLRITPQEAKAKIDAGEAGVLDVTSSLVWPAVHNRIPGSIRITPEPIIRALNQARPAAEILERIGQLPKDKALIAYCT